MGSRYKISIFQVFLGYIQCSHNAKVGRYIENLLYAGGYICRSSRGQRSLRISDTNMGWYVYLRILSFTSIVVAIRGGHVDYIGLLGIFFLSRPLPT